MIYIGATVEIFLNGGWNEDLLSAFVDKVGKLYGVEINELTYNGSLICYVQTDFDDEESTADTLIFCLSEDMLDAEFDLNEILLIDDHSNVSVSY